jgi:signal peptidase I
VPIVRRVALLLIALLVGVTVVTGVVFWQQGYRPYVVHTGSMQPTYKSGTLVIDRTPKGKLHVGEVITFRHSDYSKDLVTHRITDITSAGLIHTKGDGNGTADVWDIRPDQVRGEVIDGIPLAGYVVVFLQQPAAIAGIMLVAVALFLLWGLFFTAEPVEDEGASSGPRIEPTRSRFRRWVPSRQVAADGPPD